MAANRAASFKVAAIASVLVASIAAGYGSAREPADNRYQTCINRAAAAHDEQWAAACKSGAEAAEHDRADCLNKLDLPKTYCDVSYPSRDSSPGCILPGRIASVLDADLQRARYRCQRELQSAAQ